MKRIVFVTTIALCCGAAWGPRVWPGGSTFGAVPVSAQSGRPSVDWVTDGNDNQRTGWQRNETILTKKNVKNLIPQHNLTVAGKWPRKANQSLRGKTLGIAGVGRIGKRVAQIAKAFDLCPIGYDPYPDRAGLPRRCGGAQRTRHRARRESR